MAPKKSKSTKTTLKKTKTMAATVAAGQEFLQRKTNANRSTSSDDNSSGTEPAKTKPNLSKTRTMQNTTTEAKVILGDQVLADTRAETKRRQAAAQAKNAPKKVKKPALKRLGTMAKTATEGKAYVKRATASKKKQTKKAAGRAAKK